MQEESKTLDTPNNETYGEFNSFLQDLIKAGLDENKRLSVDLYNIQLAHIRQLIYLAITITAAISAVIVNTPQWRGEFVEVSGLSLFFFITLCLSLVLSVVAFIVGVISLRGGDIPVIVEDYVDLADEALSADGCGKSTEARQKLLILINDSIQAHRNAIVQKASKIRALNPLILCAACCAAVSVLALFSTTLWSNYVQQRAVEICSEKYEYCSVRNESTTSTKNTKELKERSQSE